KPQGPPVRTARTGVVTGKILQNLQYVEIGHQADPFGKASSRCPAGRVSATTNDAHGFAEGSVAVSLSTGAGVDRCARLRTAGAGRCHRGVHVQCGGSLANTFALHAYAAAGERPTVLRL